MFRRREFIHRISAAGATGLTVSATNSEETKIANFHVKGFTCITCAVGLEVVLREQKGIVRAKATYPEGKVVVGFDASITSDDAIKDFINKTTGFTVTKNKE